MQRGGGRVGSHGIFKARALLTIQIDVGVRWLLRGLWPVVWCRVVMCGPCVAYRGPGNAVTCGQCADGAAVQRAVQRLRMRGIGHVQHLRSAMGIRGPALCACAARRVCVRLRVL